MEKKTEIQIEVTDLRPGMRYGKYHGQRMKLINSGGVLFIQYSTMDRPDQADANKEVHPGRISIWAKNKGEPDDIRLGKHKLRLALSQIGMEMVDDESTGGLKITYSRKG